MVLELVMDMEVDKVADEVADMEVDMEVDWHGGEGGQIFNYCKWRHLVVKFPTSARIFKEVIIVPEVKRIENSQRCQIVKEVKIDKEVKIVKKKSENSQQKKWK